LYETFYKHDEEFYEHQDDLHKVVLEQQNYFYKHQKNFDKYIPVLIHEHLKKFNLQHKESFGIYFLTTFSNLD
ncbi:hypothetical protein KCU89_g5863, partial [Aureobasidium melanogenum]